MRVTSPDGRVDALLIDRDTGPNTMHQSLVYLVPKGETAHFRAPAVFTADHVDDLRLHWPKNKHLAIEYGAARIIGFRGYWHHRALDSGQYEVKITETEQPPAGDRLKAPPEE